MGHRSSGFTFPVLSDFWPHGAVSQAYGVFNDDTGFANRGTFAVDRDGVIRFAEMQGSRARSAIRRCGRRRWRRCGRLTDFRSPGIGV